ncbi:hypothetical protein IBTHAUMO2_110002 [Nitrosopumilaceae archaeon]|nr:hypothetical protein IBTHAUMO2_110002 [Nitrosopumilaceae archaeon]
MTLESNDRIPEDCTYTRNYQRRNDGSSTIGIELHGSYDKIIARVDSKDVFQPILVKIDRLLATANKERLSMFTVCGLLERDLNKLSCIVTRYHN